MENTLNDVFEQARKLVADVDRKIAEEQERKVAMEKQAIVSVVSAQLDDAFDFSSREKIELNTRVDVHDGAGALEFVVRSARSMFLLSEDGEPGWLLRVIQADREPESLGWFLPGDKTLAPHENGSRRLAAARVVAAISAWVLQHGNRPSEPQEMRRVESHSRETQVPESRRAVEPAEPQPAAELQARPAVQQQPRELPATEVRTTEPRVRVTEPRIQESGLPGWKPPVSATAPKPNFGTFGKIFGH